MKSYEMITTTQACQISLDHLVSDYNNAIETIWHLRHKLQAQILENEQLWRNAYEKLADKLHG